MGVICGGKKEKTKEKENCNKATDRISDCARNILDRVSKLDYSSQIGERAKALTSCKDYNPSDRI